MEALERILLSQLLKRERGFRERERGGGFSQWCTISRPDLSWETTPSTWVLTSLRTKISSNMGGLKISGM